MHVTDVRELGIADALADGDELGRHGEPGVEVAGIGERRVRVGERERKRVVVADSPRHLDGLRTDDEATLLLRREVQLERQRRQHARAESGVFMGEQLERVLEQRDHGLVPAGVRHDVAAKAPDRGPGEPLGVTQRASKPARLREGGL